MACATLVPAGAALAQNVDAAAPTIGTIFDRGRTIAVDDRVQPGYDPRGLKFGSILVLPRIDVGTTYIDNIYVGSTDKVDDIAVSLTPSVRVTSLWNRHRLNLSGSVDANRYLSTPSENSTTMRFDGTFRYDIGGGISVAAIGGWRRQTERRSDPGAINSTRDPLEFNVLNYGGVASVQRGRMRAQLSLSQSRFNYLNNHFRDGRLADFTYRDRTSTYLTGKAEYAITADLAAMVQVNHTRNKYRDDPAGLIFNRSSKRSEILGGASFEFTDLLRGEVGLGYIKHSYDLPFFRSFSGLGGRVKLEYFPTGLTTVTFDASRTIEETGSPFSPSYFSTRASLQVDHELRRNFIVSASIGYGRNKFRIPPSTDKRPSFSLSARYLMNRNMTAFASFDHMQSSVSSAFFSNKWKLNIFRIGLSAGF